MRTIATATLALLAMTAAASAHDWGQDRIDRRQSNQERRIEHGLRSGEITRSEYHRLQAEQARIRDMERQAKRDGYVDRYEARRIEAAQDSASRHIWQEKHDGQRRWHAGRRDESRWHRRWW